MVSAAKIRHRHVLGELLSSPVAVICLTLALLLAANHIIYGKTILSEVFVNNNYSDVLTRIVTNGSNHVHPWLATTVTIVVLILIIIIIILFSEELNAM